MSRRLPADKFGETAWDHGEPRVVSVYDGRLHVGSVCVGRSIRAVTPDGLELGTFDNENDARAAIRAHWQDGST